MGQWSLNPTISLIDDRRQCEQLIVLNKKKVHSLTVKTSTVFCTVTLTDTLTGISHVLQTNANKTYLGGYGTNPDLLKSSVTVRVLVHTTLSRIKPKSLMAQTLIVSKTPTNGVSNRRSLWSKTGAC